MSRKDDAIVAWHEVAVTASKFMLKLKVLGGTQESGVHAGVRTEFRCVSLGGLELGWNRLKASHNMSISLSTLPDQNGRCGGLSNDSKHGAHFDEKHLWD